jgi:2-polyprenyl-3-methyl-5-hydroxy-6-metoxy-1,4-benzoquinol methylase
VFKADLARSRRLFAAFRKEQADPEIAYVTLARDTVGLMGRWIDLAGKSVVDIGGGAGYFAEAMQAEGASVVCIDVDAGEMKARGGKLPDGAVIGSAMSLPLRENCVDVAFSSNVLEHVPDPFAMADEMLRVTRPGGTVFLAFTNWLSPWGGHETSPWHYLGGHHAARRYARRRGKSPKNVYGESLFPVSVSAALRWARRQRNAELVHFRPRYLPDWARPVVYVPGVREFVTWNLVLVLRKR